MARRRPRDKPLFEPMIVTLLYKLGSVQNTGVCYPGLGWFVRNLEYIPRNMHTVFALLCFVVVIHWLIFPYPSGLLHWHCGNLTIAPVPAKQPWWIWIDTSCEFIMNDCVTTTKQSTTKPCAYLLWYTVPNNSNWGVGSMFRYSPPILICFIVYSFQFSFPLWVWLGTFQNCHHVQIPLHCPSQSKWGCPPDNQISQYALLRCSSIKHYLAIMPQKKWNWQMDQISING